MAHKTKSTNTWLTYLGTPDEERWASSGRHQAGRPEVEKKWDLQDLRLSTPKQVSFNQMSNGLTIPDLDKYLGRFWLEEACTRTASPHIPVHTVSSLAPYISTAILNKAGPP